MIVSPSGSLNGDGATSAIEFAAELGETSEEPPTPTPLSPVGVPSFSPTEENNTVATQRTVI